jgi:cell division protein FtsB
MKPKYALIFVGLLFLHSLISDSGIIKMFRVRSEIRKVKKEISDIQSNSQQQEKKLNEVHKNPRLIETYARTKLGLIKPNETVYEMK